MKKILFALALLLTIGAIDAYAQSNPPLSNKRIRMKGQAAAPTPDPPTGYYNLWVDSATGTLYITDDGGTDTPVGAGFSGLTAAVIPAVAAGGSSLEDSKMTTSGGSKGTWTLYDTGGTGISALNVRAGASQSTNALQNWRSAADAVLASVTSSGGITATGASTIAINSSSDIGLVVTQSAGWNPTGGTGDGNFALRVSGYSDLGGFRINAADVDNSLYSPTAFGFSTGGATIKFGAPSAATFRINTSDGSIALGSAGANFDIGAVRSAAGILAVTDGSTGQGGIGIADSATNTVSDALILRHQGGAVAANFGTGLLFQGENDAGVMHDMASIDAVYANPASTAEETRFVFKNHHSGTEATFLTMWQQFGETYLVSPGFLGLSGSSARITALAASPIYFATGNTDRWLIDSSGHLQPNTTNTYDIGTSSLLVRNNYVSTSIQGTRTKTFDGDNDPTNIVQISSATALGVTGGYIEYTVVAASDEATDEVQTETAIVPFVLVNESGTVTATIGTEYGSAIDSAGGGALAVSWTATVTGTNVMMECTSDYDAAVLNGTVTHTISYRVVLTSGTATVTPQ